MPRAETSAAGRIIAFFRTSPLETADLILGLCKDAVSERKSKSQQAKARATAGATPAAAAAAPAAGKAKAKKKSHKKKAPAAVPPAETGAVGEADLSLPGMEPAGEEIPAGEEEYRDAGDLVNQ